MVGSAISRRLKKENVEAVTHTRGDADLLHQDSTRDYISKTNPDAIILAAAKVGGILANRDYPYDFIAQNLIMQTNVIDTAVTLGVKKFIFLGSSCIYPKHAPQPLKEEYLLTDTLEPTNEPYAIAKIAGVRMCQAANRQFGLKYISLMPTNLYGPNDNFDLETSHVLPAMIRKYLDGKENRTKVQLWGTGTPRREFLHVHDLADAVWFTLSQYGEFDHDLLNVGTGTDITIKELSSIIATQTGYQGETVWDSSKPDGTPVKRLDVSRMNQAGWNASIGLEEGIRSTIEWYQEHHHDKV
jgi:Nucleoside-diphosphate-sugar epimerases